MQLLYYWQPDNYRRDRQYGFGYHLSQNNPLLTTVGGGGVIWAFTRENGGRYVLAAEMRVRRVTHNPPRYRYGRYRAWAEVGRTRYFDLTDAPDFEPLVRGLSVRANAPRLGQSFQGAAAVRALDAVDAQLIEAFGAGLPTLSRVSFYPEDVLEARLLGENVSGRIIPQLSSRRVDYLYGVDVKARRVVREVPNPDLFGREDNDRARYVVESLKGRDAEFRRHADSLRKTYAGRCQVCVYDPQSQYGHETCQVHHVVWLSRGGENELRNLVLLCPNHHSIVHRDDAPFDYGEMAFSFSNGMTESLRLNEHLERAV
ncbi:MAG: HNH endonuclease [Chloroflexi bacterium]|jgi:5-methylcytosine-specific restriction protein A|nr:HNH endonuclease [Chloroflexota bacterium]